MALALPAMTVSGKTQKATASPAQRLKAAPAATRTRPTIPTAPGVPRTSPSSSSTSTRTSSSMSADPTEEPLPTVSSLTMPRSLYVSSARKASNSTSLSRNACPQSPTVRDPRKASVSNVLRDMNQ